MTQLDEIRQHGTIRMQPGYHRSRDGLPSNKITCADGYELSVVAGPGCHCIPGPGSLFAAETYAGPYDHAEVRALGGRPEPWPSWAVHEDTNGDFAYVPFSKIAALIDAHGGEA